MNANNIIDHIYEANNFPGFSALVKLVQKQNPSISQKQIQHFYDTQLEIQILHKQPKIKPSGHVTADLENEFWNMDIYDLSKYQNQNNGFRYILAIIDVFTRKAYCEPMMSKDSDTVGGTLQSIIMEHKVSPRVLISDSDSAYTGKLFEQVLDENKIVLDTVTIGDHHAMGIIDNFAKRLKLIFAKMILKNKSTRWISRLQEVVQQYNNTPHSAIANLTPNEAGKKEHFQQLYEINQAKKMGNNRVSDLSVGDKVRKLIKQTFDKESDPKWSDEVFEVKKVSGNSVKLSDDTTTKRENLLHVPDDTKTTDTNVITKLKK